ncbi:MAG: F0F1 ATP synthase subunit epsilon [Bacteroidaceae bacterium]|nr:F0F1 ATP synthase subunit epsilon [Bacteroidaceae bacterium]
MQGATIKITILSPERTLFSGEATRVSLPGGQAPFVVLHNHAPLISTLQKGVISWDGAENGSVAVLGGFVEVKNNEVTACVEV